MVARKTKVLEVNELSVDVLCPEQVCVQLDPAVRVSPLDVGHIAYLARGCSVGVGLVDVDLSSLYEARRKVVREILSDFYRTRRHQSILGNYRKYMRAIDWCDLNGFHEVCIDPVITKQALFTYTASLQDDIYHGRLKPITASTYQRGLVRLIELILPESSREIVQAVKPIKHSRAERLPPAETLVRHHLKVDVVIAREVSSFLMGERAFPCVLNFGDYEVVQFHGQAGAITPFSSRESVIFNAQERRLVDFNEYMEAYAAAGSTEHSRVKRNEYRNLLNSFNDNNQNPRTASRMRLASLALKAYAKILMILIGAGASEFVQFDYEEAVGVERSPLKKELSAIKFRAKGKRTRYSLGRNTGVSVLKEYLEFRAWVLNGEYSKQLFISWSLQSGSVIPLKSDFAHRYYQSVLGVFMDPKTPPLSSGAVRKFKSIALHYLGVKPAVVAGVLNHAVSTNHKDYSINLPEQMSAEFGLYWRAVRKASSLVRESSDTVEHALIPSGRCQDFNNPTSVVLEADVEPSCQTQIGCLYCTNYLCHVDEEDVHKLLSLKFFLEAMRSAATDVAHVEKLFKALSIRIEFVLSEMSALSSEAESLVSRMRVKVFEHGVLTVFWEKRLQSFERMGVVFDL